MWRFVPYRRLYGLTAVFPAVIGLFVLASAARADLSSTADDTAETNGRVSAILRLGDRIYIGGEFTRADGAVRNHLAAINANTGRLTVWAPSTDGPVMALAASPGGGRIYVGGRFSSVNGAARNNVVALDPVTGAVDRNWRAGAGGSVRALAVSRRGVYLGGDFGSVNGRGRGRLALVDRITGALNLNWAPSANGRVNVLDLSPGAGRIFAGGSFRAISGQPKDGLAAIDAVTGSPVGGWRPRTNGPVWDLEVSSTHVYVAEGGPGGVGAAYSAGSGSTAWRRRADGDVQCVGILGSRVYFGGHFIRFSGRPRRFFAAVDATSGAVGSWDPSGRGFAGCWALTGDERRTRLYAGGDFTGIAGRERRHFAQFSDPSASPDTRISSGPAGVRRTGSAGLEYVSAGPGSSLECGLDGAARRACSSPERYAGLSGRDHALRVRELDPWGNAAPTPVGQRLEGGHRRQARGEHLASRSRRPDRGSYPDNSGAGARRSERPDQK